MTSPDRPAAYRRAFGATQPPYRFDPYASTQLRSPGQAPVRIEQTLSELTGPLFDPRLLRPGDDDLLTPRTPGGGTPIGQRIVVHGRVLDEGGEPVRDSLIEIWQANAAGRYDHPRDQWQAPLDPNFHGAGRAFTDAQGRYRFRTVRPGAYPWKNHYNAWRPAHIHFSLFGNAYATRLVTQMYFPGDDLLPFDPIFNATADPIARQRLIAKLDWAATRPDDVLAFEFDIVLRGRDSTPSG